MLIAPSEREDQASQRSRLLIVEDDASTRDLLRQWFQNDYRLVFADNSIQAVALLLQEPIDLALLDVSIPGMRNFEMLRDLRDEQLGSELPVILISTLNDNVDIVQGLQMGANDYITRPLEADVIRARVSTQIALKHAEDERKKTINQLKFTQEMQENFTRIVSHDLKGPLTNIRMAQFMLRDIMRDNDEARSILDNMDSTLNGMIEMLRVFLDAMDSQQLEPQLEAVQVHDLVVEIVEQYRLAAERKQIQLTIRDSDRRVRADGRLLRQVLNNLISNAVKFSPEDTETNIWADETEGKVRLCVADGGPGIPADERQKLFTMFSKLSTRPTGGETSTGLGLWIVKELTQLQGGQVGVDQAAGGGALFWVELPSA